MPAQAERAGGPCCRPHTTSCSCSTAKAKDPSSPRLCRPALTPRAFTQKRTGVGAASCRAEMAEPHAASIRNLRGTVRRGRISGRTRRNARLRRPQPAQRHQWKVGKTQAGSYVVLIAASIGVMVQVSKWCCHPSKTGTCIPHQQEKKTGDFSCREKHPRTQPDASR